MHTTDLVRLAETAGLRAVSHVRAEPFIRDNIQGFSNDAGRIADDFTAGVMREEAHQPAQELVWLLDTAVAPYGGWDAFHGAQGGVNSLRDAVGGAVAPTGEIRFNAEFSPIYGLGAATSDIELLGYMKH